VGSNELVVNGDFATDSDWVKSAGAYIINGVGGLSSEQYSYLAQNINVQTGLVYKVILDVVTASPNNVVVFSSSGCFGSQSVEANTIGRKEFIFICTNGSYPLKLITLENNPVQFDNVSVKRLIQTV